MCMERQGTRPRSHCDQLWNIKREMSNVFPGQCICKHRMSLDVMVKFFVFVFVFPRPHLFISRCHICLSRARMHLNSPCLHWAKDVCVLAVQGDATTIYRNCTSYLFLLASRFDMSWTWVWYLCVNGILVWTVARLGEKVSFGWEFLQCKSRVCTHGVHRKGGFACQLQVNPNGFKVQNFAETGLRLPSSSTTQFKAWMLRPNAVQIFVVSGGAPHLVALPTWHT